MISLVAHEYAGIELAKGDTFEAEEQHVQILTGLGRARVADSQEYMTRDMNAGRSGVRGRRMTQKTT